MCYSVADGKQVITSYLAYTFNGQVIVEPWKDESALKRLFENIDMEHFDITPDRTPRKIISRHLERIAGKKTVEEDLYKLAEKTYRDMYEHVPSLACLYQGSVPEIPQVSKVA